MSFSVILKRLREDRSLSQKDIAEYLGITRQAVAAYEVAKREPDYNTLRKLADFFGVSVDYLLGRAGSKEAEALIVGRNIGLIRGTLSFKELSEDIRQKTGAVVSPEMLELYEKGERMPFAGTIRMLARFAGVYDSFFYRHNTAESLQLEREAARKEADVEGRQEFFAEIRPMLGFMDEDMLHWVFDRKNLIYLKFAKALDESGIFKDGLKPVMDEIMKIKKD